MERWERNSEKGSEAARERWMKTRDSAEEGFNLFKDWRTERLEKGANENYIYE